VRSGLVISQRVVSGGTDSGYHCSEDGNDVVDCNNLQLLRRGARCRLKVTRLMSRRQIQQLRDSATSRRHSNNNSSHDVIHYDDEAPTNIAPLRMSARHIRSLDDVTDQCRLLLVSKLKVCLCSLNDAGYCAVQ